jgi:uncharacterized protein YndB with AHSA1/START domain
MAGVGNTAQRSRTTAAGPAQVWAVLGDVARMPEWSEDLASVELLEGDGRSAGSRFRGNNQSGERRWSMTCVIDQYDDGRSLEFHTETDTGEIRTRWWYRISPASEGTMVTEGFQRVAKLGRLRAMAERKLIGDRAEYNARNIDASLERLAKVVEATR